MTVKTIARNKRIIQSEIDSLSELIRKRNEWLKKPENKMRRTYSAVKKDTIEMEEKLSDLNEDLNNLKN